MNFSAPIIIIGLVSVAVAVIGLFRPFVGLLVFLILYFTQPAELIPALAPLRVELVYGIILFIVFARHRATVLARALIANRVLLSSVLLLAAACLSIPFAIWRGGAFDALIYLTKLIALLFLLSGLIETNSQMRKVLWLFVGLLVYFAGAGLLTYMHGEYYALNYTLGNLNRAEGINSLVGGPNELAGLLLSLLPFVITLFRCSRNLFLKLLLIASGALALATMVLTGSRSAMIGLAFLSLYAVFTSRYRAVNFIACVALSCVIWVSIPSEYQQRLLTVKTYAEGGNLDDSNRYRLEVWRIGWKMFSDHPIVGVGAGQFSTAFGTSYSQKAHGGWMSPHNLLLQVGCELGLVGLAAFGYFLSQIIKSIRSTLRVKNKPEVKLNYQVALACGGMFLAVSVISTVGHSFYRPYWYVLAGLAVANRSLATRKVYELASERPEGERHKEPHVEPQLSPSAFNAGQA